MFWKINPGSGIQRGIGGENTNEGDKGDPGDPLFLMKYKAL